MTPTANTVEIICNDAPEDIKTQLKRLIMELTDEERLELLSKFSA